MRKKIHLLVFLKDSEFEEVQRYDAYRETTVYGNAQREIMGGYLCLEYFLFTWLFYP